MHINYKFIILLNLIVLLLFSSCFNEKKVTYFQKGVNQKDTIDVAATYIPKIESGDILSIYVNSLSSEASSFFNPYTGNVAVPSSTDGGGSLTQTAAPGYLVDAKGNIELPLIGMLPVSGLSTNEVGENVKKLLATYLKEPTVNVRFLNYKISIVGEVAKPGVYVIPNERITLPEAIIIAGDLTTYAKRKEIEIIRDVNGKKEFGQVDLTSRDIFKSPYYYLHANDIIYVKAGKSKLAQSDLTLKLLPVAVSVITLLILIIK